ncbi:MAG: hypothetical protein KF678_14655 [Phycisphaeraceae bacterium]|nr:hypothetical protein [Phycisphaeraceae bacterium]
MKKVGRNISTLAILAGTAMSAYAQQPAVINLSGATLLENFLKAPAATNDYLDCDGDGIAGILNTGIDNLTPTNTSTAWTSADHWALSYRVAGSVAGYQELIDFGQSAVANCASPSSWPGNFVTGFAGLVNPPNVVFSNTTTGPVTNAGASKQYYNGSLVYDTTTGTPFFASFYIASNPAGLPYAANLTTLAAVAGNPAAGGYRVDAAPVDVPSTWAVRGSGTAANAAPTRLPGQTGYGRNPRTSVNAQGTATGAGFDYNLANLGNRNLNVSSPDCNTIFDSQIAFAPIAMLTSFGTGIRQMDQTEVNHFFSTGRLFNGENLHTVTREIGSGTRNGFNNTAGIDPSWGVGDNVGGSAPQNGSTGNQNLLGSQYVPANKIGSGDVETTIRNSRLGMGYSGAERFTVANSARYDLVAIRCSLAGGTQFARPTLNNLLDNDPSTNPSLYSIGGPAILATIGDPRNQSVLGGTPGNTNPRMANVEAAKFVNNMTRSIENFITVPGTPQTFGMPGEWAATLLILNPARKFINDPANPTQLIPNALYNPALGAALPPYSVLDDAQFLSFGTGSPNLAGQSPARLQGAGITYSDGVPNGTNYINQGGANVGYNTTLATRNRIAGDFNGDGLRNLNDALDMMRAYHQRNGGPDWVAPAFTGPNPGTGTAGSEAVIEILGDFNGDGNFDAKDIRYWADGLAIDPVTGKLDRKKGFEAVDNAWFTLTGNNNFFGTTKSGGGAYVAGDSRFDVVGSGGIARGWAPVGADGVIDAQDAAYVAAQFIGNPFVLDGAANWNNTSEAVGFDLSADMTGDLIVDQADLNAINAAIGVGGCYANCDQSTGSPLLTANDFQCFLNKYAAGDTYANCDQSTGTPLLTANDFQCFLNKFAAGCS